MIGRFITLFTIIFTVFCFNSKHIIVDAEGNNVAILLNKVVNNKGVLRMELNNVSPQKVNLYTITPRDSVKDQILLRYSQDFPDDELNETIYHLVLFQNGCPIISKVVFFSKEHASLHNRSIDPYLEQIGLDFGKEIALENQVADESYFAILFRMHYW